MVLEAIRMTRGKVPFQWLDLPENLRLETEPHLLAVHQAFNPPTRGENITRYAGTILILGIAVKLVFDVLRYEPSELDELLPPAVHLLPLVPASGLVVLAIMLNLRRRVKRLIFDFNTGTVRLQARTFSYVGRRSAAFSTPFSVMLKPNTREKEHHSSDEHSSRSWTTSHEGYEVLVPLEKKGPRSVLFLETDDLKRDYGEFFAALARVAGIDDPLMEETPFWTSVDG